MSGPWVPTKPRGPIAASFTGPGPNVNLPTCLGGRTAITKCKKPEYTFGTRFKESKLFISPGPCYKMDPHVTRKGVDGTPHYSLYGRNKDIMRFKTPGPGQYSPEKAGDQSKYRSPIYSLSSRTKGTSNDKTPAPNCYSLPKVLGGKSCVKPSLPSYSMTSRSKIGSFHEDLQKTPGPGTYPVTNPNTNRNKAPVYSMTGRNQLPSDSTRKPGPGAHSPEKVTVTKRQAPAPSFGIHHSPYITPLIIDCSE